MALWCTPRALGGFMAGFRGRSRAHDPVHAYSDSHSDSDSDSHCALSLYMDSLRHSITGQLPSVMDDSSCLLPPPQAVLPLPPAPASASSSRLIAALGTETPDISWLGARQDYTTARSRISPRLALGNALLPCGSCSGVPCPLCCDSSSLLGLQGVTRGMPMKARRAHAAAWSCCEVPQGYIWQVQAGDGCHV